MSAGQQEEQWNTLPAEIRLKYSLSVSESADLVD